MSSIDPESGALERQAHAWWARLHSGEATRADADAFREWATLSAAHAQAWREVMRVWEALDPLLAEEAVRQSSRAERFSWFGLRDGVHLARPGRRAFLGGAVAASVAGMMAVNPPLGLWPSVAELAADYHTGTGEQRQVALGDQISVRMNTQTRINRIGAGTGSGGMELVAGEAEVQTAGAMDFFFDAGGGRLQAHTARVNVRYTGPQVCVTCLDGRVMVSVGTQHQSLEAGGQVVYDKSGMQEPVQVDAGSVGSWGSGTLSFDRTLLSEVIDEINRYRPGKVILRNERLGRTLVSMQLSLRSIDNAPVMIRELYGARVRSLPGGIVLLS